MIYFEDFEIGDRERFGRYEVTRDEVIEFAGKYDPHPFHLSDEEAAKTHFGRISASGWHTCSMMMAMFVEHIQSPPHASHGGIGTDELRWLKPVYPGDVLSMETEIVKKRRSRSRPEMGSLWTRMTTYNQDGVAVLSMITIALYGLRNPDAPIAES
ncbi:acyl dehydratase [Croceicoccus estronivorus]|uniref:MaoC family dehydratase n=1 Tax=Croceicoccus estronivorus TaxID=1172626 RepID=UPI000836DB48|nr:MaoC family dehydratase [Croceicoccus estronivorus]OCC25050.1 acyl dehydratase [Croceicoccus estronivorus]